MADRPPSQPTSSSAANTDPVPGTIQLTAAESELGRTGRVIGRALVAYGLLGLLLGIAGLAVVAVLATRLALAGGEILPRLAQTGGSLDSVADALEDAAASSRVAASSIETTMPPVEGLADTVDRTGPTLGRIGDTLESFTILGTRPLSDAGARFSELSADLRDLGPQLRGLATGLTPNAESLRGSAESLGAVAAEIRVAARAIEGRSIGGLLGAVVAVILALLLAWVLAPAVGALLLGIWLLRRIVPGSATTMTAAGGPIEVRSDPPSP